MLVLKRGVAHQKHKQRTLHQAAMRAVPEAERSESGSVGEQKRDDYCPRFSRVLAFLFLL